MLKNKTFHRLLLPVVVWLLPFMLSSCGTVTYSQPSPTPDAAHTVQIRAFSPDNKLVAFGYTDQRVKILNLATEKVVFNQVISGNRLVWLAFTHDSNTLLVKQAPDTAMLWDIAGGKLLRTFTDPLTVTDMPTISQDDTLLVTSEPVNNQVNILEMATGKVHKRLDIASCNTAISPDSKWLMTADLGRLLLWQVSDGTLIDTLTFSKRMCHSFAFSPDSTKLAVSYSDTNLKPVVELYELKNGLKLLKSLPVNVTEAVGLDLLAFNPNGTKLVAAISGSQLEFNLWDLTTFQLAASTKLSGSYYPNNFDERFSLTYLKWLDEKTILGYSAPVSIVASRGIVNIKQWATPGGQEISNRWLDGSKL